ncbi:UNVERIFIED_CONTAM: Chitinase 1 [Siphonaria sp. JEL0065]|nr:Chitinase 1 [Siphonaria sp. JEL0065]
MSSPFLQSTASTPDGLLPVIDDAKQDVPAQRNAWLKKRIVCVTSWVGMVVILAIGGSLAGYFVSRKRSGSSGLPVSANGTGGHPLSGNKMLFGYWGQNAAGNGVDLKLGPGSRKATEDENEKPLAYYCDQGFYQTMNIAFLYSFGGLDGHWGLDLASWGRITKTAGGTFLNGNNIAADPTMFLSIGDDIKHCQSLGVKVVLSIGGDKASPYDFIKGAGVQVGNMIYNTFLGGNATHRPFGNAVFDGIELDIEKTRPGYTEEMISLLQTIKKLSPSTLLSAVPQCYLNDETVDLNTGPVIQSHPELLDYIIVQYYNNPTCSYPFGFNFDSWTERFKGPIVVGLAGNETSAITGGFLNAGQLQAVVDMIYNNPQFYGISVYDVSSANLSPYAHTLREVLDGKVVGSGYLPQGPPQDESKYAARCGPTWNYANATCSHLSVPCVPGTSCGSQQCFTFLQKC